MMRDPCIPLLRFNVSVVLLRPNPSHDVRAWSKILAFCQLSTCLLRCDHTRWTRPHVSGTPPFKADHQAAGGDSANRVASTMLNADSRAIEAIPQPVQPWWTAARDVPNAVAI